MGGWLAGWHKVLRPISPALLGLALIELQAGAGLDQYFNDYHQHSFVTSRIIIIQLIQHFIMSRRFILGLIYIYLYHNFIYYIQRGGNPRKSFSRIYNLIYSFFIAMSGSICLVFVTIRWEKRNISVISIAKDIWIWIVGQKV